MGRDNTDGLATLLVVEVVAMEGMTSFFWSTEDLDHANSPTFRREGACKIPPFFFVASSTATRQERLNTVQAHTNHTQLLTFYLLATPLMQCISNLDKDLKPCGIESCSRISHRVAAIALGWLHGSRTKCRAHNTLHWLF